MTTAQKKEWQEALRQAHQLKDGLKMPVDDGIVETVAIFRLLGFTTTASCGGHLRRVTGGPYINFESPEAIQLAAQARQLRKPVTEIDPQYNELRKGATRLSMLEVQKLVPYLDAFYVGREVPYARRLIIRTFPLTYNCLKCQGAELADVVDGQERQRILDENQGEMYDFTEFLKATYFGAGT